MVMKPAMQRLPYIKLNKDRVRGVPALTAVAPVPNAQTLRNRSNAMAQNFMRSRAQTLYDPGLNPVVADRIRQEYGINDEDFKDIMVSTGMVLGGAYGAFKGAKAGASVASVIGTSVSSGLSAAASALGLGQAGPQVMIPEEFVTVPLAFILGTVGAYIGMKSGAAAGGALAGTVTPSGMAAASELIRDTLINAVEKEGAKGVAISAAMLAGSSIGGWAGSKVGYTGLGAAIGGKIGTSTAIGLDDLVNDSDTEEVGVMAGLNMMGNSMDQFSGASAIKAAIIAIQEDKSVDEMINRAYGNHEEGFTQLDFSRIRANTGLDLGVFGNGVIDFAGELLTDPGVWYSNLEAQSSKYYRNKTSEFVIEQSFRGKNKGGVFGVFTGKGENFYKLIGTPSAKRIGEFIKEGAVSKLTPKTFLGKVSEAIAPKIKEFNGFEAFKQEMLFTNKNTAMYLTTRFLDAQGRVSMKQIDNFLKDIYKEIETGTIARIDDSALKMSTKHGLVRNKFKNMLEELKAKGLIDGMDMNSLTASQLRRTKIRYSSKDYNTFIKKYRGIKMSDATDNAMAQASMFILNPTMMAFGYGRRSIFKALSHPASFRSYLIKAKNMLGFNKNMSVKETDVRIIFKRSKILQDNIKLRNKEIRTKFYDEPYMKALEEKVEALNETIRVLDEIDEVRDQRYEDSRQQFDDNKDLIKENWQETKKQIKKDYKQRNKEIYDETQQRIDETLKEYEVKKKEVDDKIKEERAKIQLLVFHNGERVRLDETLVSIYEDRIKQLLEIKKQRPLNQTELDELNAKRDALSVLSYNTELGKIAEDIKLEINSVEHLLTVLAVRMKSMENLWNFTNRNTRFEEEIDKVDEFMQKFTENKKGIDQGDLDELARLITDKGNRNEFISKYNAAYENRNGKYQFDEYWKRMDNIKKRVTEYDNMRESERYSRFIKSLQEDAVYMDMVTKYQEWITNSMMAIEVMTRGEMGSTKLYKRLMKRVNSSFALKILETQESKFNKRPRNGLDDNLQGELEQVIQNFQADPNFARGNSKQIFETKEMRVPSMFHNSIYKAFNKQLTALGILEYKDIRKQKTMLSRESVGGYTLREFTDIISEAEWSNLFNRYTWTDDGMEDLKVWLIQNEVYYETILSTDFQRALIMAYFNSNPDSAGYADLPHSYALADLSKSDLADIASILYGKESLEDMQVATAKVIKSELNYKELKYKGKTWSIEDFIKEWGKDGDYDEFMDIDTNGLKDYRGEQVSEFRARSKQVEILDRVRGRYYYFQINQSIIRTEMMLKDYNSGMLESLLDIFNGETEDGIGKIFSDILAGNAINAESRVISEIRTKLEDTIASNNSMMNILTKSKILKSFLNNRYDNNEVVVEGFFNILRHFDRLNLLDVAHDGLRKVGRFEFEQKIEYATRTLYEKNKDYMDFKTLDTLIRHTVDELRIRYADMTSPSTKLYSEFKNQDATQIMDVFSNVQKVWKDQIGFEKASETEARQAASEGLQIQKDFNRLLMEDMTMFTQNVGLEIKSPFTRAKIANDYLKTHLFDSEDIQQKVNWNQMFNINDLVFKNSPFILRQPRSKSDAAKTKRLFKFLYSAEGKLDDMDYETRTKIMGRDINRVPGPDGTIRENVSSDAEMMALLMRGEEPENIPISKTLQTLAQFISSLKDYNDTQVDIYEFMKIWEMMDGKHMQSFHVRMGMEYYTKKVFPNRSVVPQDFDGLEGVLAKMSMFTENSRHLKSYSVDQMKAILGYYTMLMDTPNNIKNVPEFKMQFVENNKKQIEIHQRKIEEYKKETGYAKRKEIDTSLFFIFQNVPKEYLTDYILQRFNLKNLNSKLRKAIAYIIEVDGKDFDYNREEVRTLTSYIVRTSETDGNWSQKVKTNLDIEKERVKNELRRKDLTVKQRERLETRKLQLRDKKYLSRTNHRYNWKERNRVDWTTEFVEGPMSIARNNAMQGVFDEAGQKYTDAYEERSARFVDELAKQKEAHEQNYKDFRDRQEQITEETKAQKEVVYKDLEKIHNEFGELNPNRVLGIQSKAFELLVGSVLEAPLKFIRFIQSKGIRLGMRPTEFVRRYNAFIETSRQDGLLHLKDRSYSIKQEEGRNPKSVRDTKTIEVNWNDKTFTDDNGKVRDIPEWMILQDAELRSVDFRDELNNFISERLGDPEFEYAEGTTRKNIQEEYQAEVAKAYDNQQAQARRVFNIEKLFKHTIEDLIWYFTDPNTKDIKYEEMFKFLDENEHLKLIAVMKENSDRARGYGPYQRDKFGKPILDDDGNPTLKKNAIQNKENIAQKDLENFMNGEYDIDKPVAKELVFSSAEELEGLVKDLNSGDNEAREYSIGIMPIESFKRASKISWNKYELPGPLQSYYAGFERLQKFDMLLNSSFHPRNLLDVIKKNSQLVNSLGDTVDYLQWGYNTMGTYHDLRTMQKNDFEVGTTFYKLSEGATDPDLIERGEGYMNRMLDSREPELLAELEELKQNPIDNKYKIEKAQLEYDSIREIQLDWINGKHQDAMVKMYEHHYSKIGFTHYVKLMEMENIRNNSVSRLDKIWNRKYQNASDEVKEEMIAERVADKVNMLNIANQYQKTSAATDQTRYLKSLFDGDLGKKPLGKMMETFKDKDVSLNNKHLKLMHYLAQENPLAKNYMKIGTTIEQVGRLHAFMLEKHLYGTENDKAIANSLKRHYDYSDRSPMETMATVAVPFIAFPVRNAMFWAEQFRDASKIRRWYHLMNAVWGSYEGDEDDEYIQYARMNGYIPVGNTMIKLGDSRAGAMGMLTNPGQTLYNRLNPLLKGPIESLRGNGSMGTNMLQSVPFVRRIPQVMKNYKAYKGGSNLKAVLPGIFGTLYNDANYNYPAFRKSRNVYNELYNYKGSRRELSDNAYYRVRQIQYKQQSRKYI